MKKIKFLLILIGIASTTSAQALLPSLTQYISPQYLQSDSEDCDPPPPPPPGEKEPKKPLPGNKTAPKTEAK